MTKERRKVNHALQAVVLHNLSRDFKAVTTTRQMKVASRHITNVILSGKDPRTVQGLDGRLMRLV